MQVVLAWARSLPALSRKHGDLCCNARWLATRCSGRCSDQTFIGTASVTKATVWIMSSTLSARDRKQTRLTPQSTTQACQLRSVTNSTHHCGRFWGDALQLHKAIAGQKLGAIGPGVSPKTALSVGLKVDADALPAALKKQLPAGKVDLNDPATSSLFSS